MARIVAAALEETLSFLPTACHILSGTLAKLKKLCNFAFEYPRIEDSSVIVIVPDPIILL